MIRIPLKSSANIALKVILPATAFHIAPCAYKTTALGTSYVHHALKVTIALSAV
jgi:hypothetical protein